MTHLVNRLSDRLVERLVPKASAAANMGPMSERFVPCGCDVGSCYRTGN